MTLHRRMLLLGAPMAVGACGLSERPYAERRQWPLLVPRPTILPPRVGGPVVEMRELRTGPGLEARGLQTIQPDGSIRTAFYDEWAVPPAHGVEDALRNWLASSGRFSGVVGTGSRAGADLALEGELTALWVDLVGKTAEAAIAITVVDLHGTGRRIRKQATFRASAAVTDLTEAGQVRGQLAALTRLFTNVESEMM